VPPLPPAPFVYPILDVALLGARSVAEATSALVSGGARIIQLRAKRVPDGDLLELAREALAVAHAGGALLIVNDRPDVALIAGADGVHVGQDDLTPADCRRVLGPGAIVGWSAHGADDVAAADERLDYVALGPVFATTTKADAEPVVGVAAVREARRRTRLPLVAIGGITAANAGAVVAAGADGVAAVSALLTAADPADAVRRMRAALAAPA
jgi:thiamine-phosphate pyrophosphorylase